MLMEHFLDPAINTKCPKFLGIIQFFLSNLKCPGEGRGPGTGHIFHVVTAGV